MPVRLDGLTRTDPSIASRPHRRRHLLPAIAGLAATAALAAAVLGAPPGRGAAAAPRSIVVAADLNTAVETALRAAAHRTGAPLRGDRLIQDGAKLRGPAGSGFGYSLAVAADGDTAIVGAPYSGATPGTRGRGAVWIFTRSGSTWHRQAGPFGGSDEVGRAGFGWSVALSASGGTALVGGIGDDGDRGAAWVFTRSGSTWHQQGPKLTPHGETGAGAFGWSVTLSSRGDVALIGAPDDDHETGAAWLFTRSGSRWRERGPKLAGAALDDQFGSGVALSGNGRTALIGSSGNAGGVGAVWALTRSGSTWSSQPEKLTGRGEIGAGAFGWTVALSSDGDTALVGNNARAGAAWLFARSAAGWRQEGPALTGTGEVGNGTFSASVALSGDGRTALIGGLGVAWVYTRKGATWSPHGSTLTGTNQATGGPFAGGRFGFSVALSADGSTAWVGAPGDDGTRGAVWVFER